MTRPRFSLRSATIGIVLVAVGLAALKFPNRYATAGLYTLTLAVLLAATLAAVVRRDRSTALGAALFGWGFLLMTTVGWLRMPYDELIVGPLLEDLYPRIHNVRDSAITTASGTWQAVMPASVTLGGSTILRPGPSNGSNFGVVVSGPPVWRESEHFHRFARIGELLTCLLAVGLGAMLGRFFGARPGRDESEARH